MNAIQLEEVSFSYGEQGQTVPVLRDMSLAVRQGEFVCILGGSGCGKTTLLRLIAGLQTAQSGRISAGGRTVEGPGTDRAVVFQDHALFPWMTARKNVQFAIRQARPQLSRREVRETAAAFLEQTGMAEAADRYPCQLSGGMQQRTAMARALAMDSEILLLDEPFAALDARNRQTLQTLLERLWRGGGRRKTVVFVTHDLAEAVRLADRVLYLDQGRIAGGRTVALPRPRDGEENAEALQRLRQELLRWFYPEGREQNEADKC